MIYEPLFENGVYVDNINLFEKNKPGKTHVCECRENHDAFFSRTAFMQHIKLKCHQKWLMAFRPTISPILEPLLAPILPPLSLSEPLSLPSPLLAPTLREEQDDEYERTLKEDRRKVQDNFAAIIRESEEIYRVEQEKRVQVEELERKRKSISEPGYTFRFIFPDGKKVSYTIHKTRPVSYMRDIVDVYMADHQNIYSYELFMFPNRILDAIHTIEEAGIENRSTIYVRSIE